jgi:hypothetical protein
MIKILVALAVLALLFVSAWLGTKAEEWRDLHKRWDHAGRDED